MDRDEIDRQLSIIRADLALGRFDRQELDMLAAMLEGFDGFVKIHREKTGEEEHEGCLSQ